jgi:hypothetical protein
VSDISSFAECGSILNRDDEIISQQGIHGCNIPSLVSGIPFVLKAENVSRSGWLILGKSKIQSPNCKRGNDKK